MSGKPSLARRVTTLPPPYTAVVTMYTHSGYQLADDSWQPAHDPAQNTSRSNANIDHIFIKIPRGQCKLL